MKHALFIALLVLAVPTAGISPRGDPAPVANINVILILDNSGSMETSDPKGLRFTGARMFLSLLDAGDSAGVILFSTDSVPLTDGLITIRHEDDKTVLLNQIHERPPEGYTDVMAAFLYVNEWLNQADLRDRTTYVIFLTDGKPDIPDMPAGYEEETIHLAKYWNIPVLSIALTSSAQTPFLDRLARESSGRVIPADHAADLLDAYLGILGQIKDRTILTASPDELFFFLNPGLAPYIGKVSFILSSTGNGAVRLDLPGGGMMSAKDERVRFYLNEPGFIIFTIENPPSGKWQFHTQGVGEFKAYAILHSRLRVAMDTLGAHLQQSKPMLIELQMLEELDDGSHVQIVGDATFTAIITLPDGTQESLDLFYDDGTHGDVQEADGTFSRLYMNTHQVGTYSIDIQGHKADAPVESHAIVEVITFPQLRLQEPVGFHEFVGEALTVRVLIENKDHFPLEGGEIIASVVSPSGKIQVIQLSQEGSIYSADYLPQEEGLYQIRVSGRNTIYRGLPFEEAVSSQFEVKFIRTLSIETGEWISNGCFDRRGYAPTRLRVSGPDPATIKFSISGADGLQPYPASINTSGGPQEFILKVTSPSGRFPPGNHQFQLEVASPVEFKLQPTQALFSFEVPNVYHRCESVFKWGGAMGFLLTFVALVAVNKIRAIAKPAFVTGTLRYWQVSPSLSSPSFEHDLNPFSKGTILIGDASDCDVSIPNFGLDDRHFCLIAEKMKYETQVILKPIGEVHRGYSQLHTPVVLRHRDIFRINDLNFQYLSDSGE